LKIFEGKEVVRYALSSSSVEVGECARVGSSFFFATQFLFSRSEDDAKNIHIHY